MYTDTEIQQTLATADSKITLEAYSRGLKKVYGLQEYCAEFTLGCLLLYRFALSNWDNRAGAMDNPYSTVGLNNLIKRINAL